MGGYAEATDHWMANEWENEHEETGKKCQAEKKSNRLCNLVIPLSIVKIDNLHSKKKQQWISHAQHKAMSFSVCRFLAMFLSTLFNFSMHVFVIWFNPHFNVFMKVLLSDVVYPLFFFVFAMAQFLVVVGVVCVYLMLLCIRLHSH